MDFYELIEKRRTCIADGPAPCSCACPLGIDVLDFIEKMDNGLFTGAYRILDSASALPGIVCSICPEPCASQCPRGDVDESVHLRDLERFCWQKAQTTHQVKHFIPPKEQTVLILGAGTAALVCGIKLARRGFPVEVVDSGDRLGIELWKVDEDLLPHEVLQSELERASETKFLTARLGESSESYDLSSFDAVLIGSESYRELTDTLPDAFSAHEVTGNPESIMCAIAEGSLLSYQIEEFIKIGKVVTRGRNTEDPYRPDMRSVTRRMAVVPADPTRLTEEEATAEASRCLQCQCSKCVDVCPMMQHYGFSFKKLMMNMLDTVDSAQMNGRNGLYPLMSCSQCGACLDVCPKDIDTGAICIAARATLHQKGQFPDARYDYWMNDMAHADSDSAAVSISTDGRSDYVYFPGCQIGAANPSYVVDAFHWLRNAGLGYVSLLLRCCGTPALWAGREDLVSNSVTAIENEWQRQGKPTFILGCPSCRRFFTEQLPQIETVSLWTLIADRMPDVSMDGARKDVSVFDPCATQSDPDSRAAVRSILKKAGYTIHEVEREDDELACCGYGGLAFAVNPDLVDQEAADNASASAFPYVTYCTNCQDSFLLTGKESRYLLDMVLGYEEPYETRDLSTRRRNRQELKSRLEDEYGIPHSELTKPWDELRLDISPEVVEKMNRSLIVDDDVKRVIYEAERSKTGIYNESRDIYIAHRKIGNVTFWVHYHPTEDGWDVRNAYCHRLSIVER